MLCPIHLIQLRRSMPAIVTDPERYWIVGAKQNFMVNEGLLGKMLQRARRGGLDPCLPADRVGQRFALDLIGAVSQTRWIDT
ncbi:MAG: hypothetical protein B6D69_05135 [gamma proteobacterium symbiont of Stewartia floridana]|nr:MAG: hypothetical protein B6D76_12065 [gamma proteobacterium symbiont of Stewartia floridana]RLW54379.1 MAG: hypothetical protein B6D69_05135 [gamma proteobacterium symbiont of Stewartia floridana]RLW59429.1 MAG: hypothetical protein B6D75_10190 [gamma proteobacterium symbiont of Stewartia floridana]RLW62289.1 MAG: hypothetical protein B6D73_20265 [gamma proteobacterium symbiont of Stewartia floridana]